MEEVQNPGLATEQQQVFEEVKSMVNSAIGARCKRGCSSAQLAPNRLALSAASGRVSVETVSGIALRYKACAGLGKAASGSVCRFKPRSTESRQFNK
jgi:hypothetical protein